MLKLYRIPDFQAGDIRFKVSALLWSVLSTVHRTIAPHGDHIRTEKNIFRRFALFMMLTGIPWKRN